MCHVCVGFLMSIFRIRYNKSLDRDHVGVDLKLFKVTNYQQNNGGVYTPPGDLHLDISQSIKHSSLSLSFVKYNQIT